MWTRRKRKAPKTHTSTRCRRVRDPRRARRRPPHRSHRSLAPGRTRGAGCGSTPVPARDRTSGGSRRRGHERVPGSDEARSPGIRASKVTCGDRGDGRCAYSRDETPIEHGVAVTVVTVDDDDEGLLGRPPVRAVGWSIGHDPDRCEVPQRAHHGYEQRVTRRDFETLPSGMGAETGREVGVGAFDGLDDLSEVQQRRNVRARQPAASRVLHLCWLGTASQGVAAATVEVRATARVRYFARVAHIRFFH